MKTKAGAIIVDKNLNTIVVYQNRSQKYGIPKGTMNAIELKNKNYKKCCIREVNEEIGVNLNSIKTVELGSVREGQLVAFIFMIDDISDLVLNSKDIREIGKIKLINVFDYWKFKKDNPVNYSFKTIHKAIKYLVGPLIPTF